jgi:hypothetical protein
LEIDQLIEDNSQGPNIKARVVDVEVEEVIHDGKLRVKVLEYL